MRRAGTRSADLAATLFTATQSHTPQTRPGPHITAVRIRDSNDSRALMRLLLSTVRQLLAEGSAGSDGVGFGGKTAQKVHQPTIFKKVGRSGVGAAELAVLVDGIVAAARGARRVLALEEEVVDLEVEELRLEEARRRARRRRRSRASSSLSAMISIRWRQRPAWAAGCPCASSAPPSRADTCTERRLEGRLAPGCADNHVQPVRVEGDKIMFIASSSRRLTR